MKNQVPGSLAATAVVLLVVLGGCGGMPAPEKSNRIKLTTDPAGATAYSDQNEIGVTPLEIVPGEHFRTGFVGLSYRYYGKLQFKKPGCETYSVEVNDAVLSRDVQVKLKCDPNYRPPVAAPVQSPAALPAGGQTAQPAASGHAPADRLERIEDLRRRGLITNEEYQILRKRVLDEL